MNNHIKYKYKNTHYVRILTERDKDQIEKLDNEFGTCGLYSLEYPHLGCGYGLFQRSGKPFVPDELIAMCNMDNDITLDGDEDFEESVEKVRTRFPIYDFSKAAICDFDPVPDDDDLIRFFMQEIVEQYNRPLFLIDQPYMKKIAKQVGFFSIEDVWVYLPEKEPHPINISDNRNETIQKSAAYLCKFCKELEDSTPKYWNRCDYCHLTGLLKDLERISKQNFSV